MLFSSFGKKLRFLTDDSKYSLFTTKDILRLVIPLFFEQLLFRLVGSADTLMVAGLGEASISAVSLVDMFNNCVSSITCKYIFSRLKKNGLKSDVFCAQPDLCLMHALKPLTQPEIQSEGVGFL